MTPLFTVVVMACFQQEHLTRYRIIGILLGVVQVAVLRGFDGPVNGNPILGIALCMAGALSYGFAALWGRKFLVGVAPVKSATCQLLSSTLIMAVVACVVDRPWTFAAPSLETLWALLALAVFGTALAYVVFFKILVRAGASNVMLVTLLIPLTVLLPGNFFLTETIESKEIIGALIIGAGLLFIDGRVLNRLRGKHAIVDREPETAVRSAAHAFSAPIQPAPPDWVQGDAEWLCIGAAPLSAVAATPRFIIQGD